MKTQAAGHVYALLSDGTTVEIRPAGPEDFDAVKTMHEQMSPGGRAAEIAFAVADHMHHKGIATLLLEHLVSLARRQQITTFTAQTLTENKAMQNVFADAGLPVIRRYADGVYEMTFPSLPTWR